MTLFELLSYNERIIVWSNVETDTVYTWNQSITLQSWRGRKGEWEETDVRMLQDTPDGFSEARAAAKRWDEGDDVTADMLDEQAGKRRRKR